MSTRMVRMGGRVWRRVFAVIAVLGLAGLGVIGSETPSYGDVVIDGCTFVTSPTPSTHTVCPGANLSGADLHGLNLAFADLDHADLDHANMNTVTGLDIDVTGATLTGANLLVQNNATYLGQHAKFDQAYIGGTFACVCMNSSFHDAVFNGATAQMFAAGSDLTDIKGSGTWSPADLTGADLSGSAPPYLSTWNLSGAVLAGANLTGFANPPTAGEVNFTGADFTGANLTNADFTADTLTNANFTGTLLVPASQSATFPLLTNFSWSTPPSLPAATPSGCDHTSGQPVPAGVTTVTCTITDGHGNVATGTFTLTFNDFTTLQIISGDGQTTTSGASFSAPLVAQMLDQNGNPLDVSEPFIVPSAVGGVGGAVTYSTAWSVHGFVVSPTVRGGFPGDASPIMQEIIGGPTATFTLHVVNPQSAHLADGSFSVGDASMTEGNAGTRNLAFTVTLSRAQTSTKTVKYSAIAFGTATAGTDFTAASNVTLTFTAGTLQQTIQVPVKGDTTVEGDETFSVLLSSPSSGTTLGRSLGVGTIINDD